MVGRLGPYRITVGLEQKVQNVTDSTPTNSEAGEC